MTAHSPETETTNHITFRDCFTFCVGQSLAISAKKPPKRKSSRARGRKKSASQPAASDEPDETDDAQLSEFLEVLATLRHSTLA